MNEIVVIVSPFARVVVDEHCDADTVLVCEMPGADLHAIKDGDHCVIPAERVAEIFDRAAERYFKERFGLEWR